MTFLVQAWAVTFLSLLKNVLTSLDLVVDSFGLLGCFLGLVPLMYTKTFIHVFTIIYYNEQTKNFFFLRFNIKLFNKGMNSIQLLV